MDNRKKVNLTSDTFDGFYGTLHGENIEMQIVESEFSEIVNISNYDFIDYQKTYENYSANFVDKLSNVCGITLKFSELWSPREYNFRNDEISVFISDSDIIDIFSKVDKNTLKTVTKKYCTPCSGYIPFYKVYNENEKTYNKNVLEWDSIQLGFLFEAFLMDNDIEPNTFVDVPFDLKARDYRLMERMYTLNDYLYKRSNR